MREGYTQININPKIKTILEAKIPAESWNERLVVMYQAYIHVIEHKEEI